MDKAIRCELASLVAEPVQWNCRLDRYTSFGIGGPAAALVRLGSLNELQAMLVYLRNRGLAWRIIGRGTNLLISDDGFPGVILLLGGEFEQMSIEPASADERVRVRAGAACSLPKLASRCGDAGLSGLEFASGIPGTVGGAVIMNAGAWGADMASITGGVTLVDDYCVRRIAGAELDFGYRQLKSFAPYRQSAVVVEVELLLQVGETARIRELCRRLQADRKRAQPADFPSAGSFFKNPPAESAGRLIDASGLKGTRVGGAMISPHHGNFLVNVGGATAEDVRRLMQLVQQKVYAASGIELEPEVHFL